MIYPVHQDTPDSRDLVMVSAAKVASVRPDKYDLSKFLGPVKNQGDLGCCSGFAYAGYREYLYRKFFEYEKDKTVPADKMVFSPLFLYYEERKLEGDINQDGGAQMRSGCRVLNTVGICPETDDKYNPSHFAATPTSEMYTDAAKYKAGAYHRVLTTLDDVRNCIASDYPVAAGIKVYSSFESQEVAQYGGHVPMPNLQTETFLGGHAILMFGYDDNKKQIKCRNSWGDNWGDEGNFYLPYDFINPTFVLDTWMIHLGKAW